MIDFFVAVISIVLVAFFSGVETAFVSCNKIRMRHKKDKGIPRARIVWDMIQNPHRMLGTTLAGTNLFVVTATIFATHFFIGLFGERGTGIAALVMTPLILIFGEIIPKSVSRLFADRVTIESARILLFFQKLLFPIVVSIESITNAIIRIFGLKHSKKAIFISKEDIELLVRQIAREGILERSEQSAIHQIFDFRYTRVGEIMVRLRNIVFVDLKDDKKEILDKAQKYKFTRYPVLQDGRIKGILNVFDLFYNEGEWHKFIRPARQVFSNERINLVLYKMQRNKDLMCPVVRNGKFIGIITLEDIINEIELI